MDTSHFDHEISARKSEVEMVAKEMEASKKAFVGAVKPFVSEWIKDRVERAVRSNPAVTKKLFQNPFLSCVNRFAQMMVAASS